MSKPRRKRPPTTRRSSAPGKTKGRRAPAQTRGKLASSAKGLGGDQVEGRQAVRELLLAGTRKVHEVLVATDQDDRPIVDDIIELARSRRVPIHEVGRGKLRAAARTDAPQGVVARAAPLREHDLSELTGPRGSIPAFLLALDGITDPGNLGALLRTAEGAGVTGVVLPRHRAAHITPTVTKAAAGAVEHLRLALVGGLPAALTQLTDAGIWNIGFDIGGRVEVHDGVPAMEDGVCVVLGAEGSGLSRLVRERCDDIVSIPLAGHLDSLNVAAAGAIALFEVVRTRRRN